METKSIMGVTNNNTFVNAHMSYKGKSIIVDYQHVMHAYIFDDKVPEGMVPVEIYPIYGDCTWDFIPLDPRYGKVDLAELIKWADTIIEEEKRDMD